MGLAAIASFMLASTGQPAVVRPVIPVAPPPAPQSLPRGPQPVTNPGSWVQMFDYPAAALREEKQGVTRFRVEVDASGLITDCVITESSGSPLLDQTTCDKLRVRARFQPALDVKGKPTVGSYANAVRWVIPKQEPRAGPVAMDSELSINFAADGTPFDCKVIKPSSVPPFDKVGPVTCPAPKIIPYKDAAGNAVSRRVIISNRIEVLPVD